MSQNEPTMLDLQRQIEELKKIVVELGNRLPPTDIDPVEVEAHGGITHVYRGHRVDQEEVKRLGGIRAYLDSKKL